MDFKTLNSSLLADARILLTSWLPGGKLVGREYCCGSLRGEAGSSLKVNIDNGLWADFATGEKGGDLISLYAAIHGLSQREAANKLNAKPKEKPNQVPRGTPKPEAKIVKPPTGIKTPDMSDKKLGQPSEFYTYTNEQGDLLFFVARYDLDDGKELRPFCYTDQGTWVRKMWPGKRPLYGLGPELTDAKYVLIVEGEKSVHAAQNIVGSGPYKVVTWSGGVNATDKTDWTPLFGKNILIWPDADEPGKKAALDIASRLTKHCPEIKIIDLGEINGGWDAADALTEGMTWAKFKEWAKPRTKTVDKSVEIVDKPAPVEATATITYHYHSDAPPKWDDPLPTQPPPDIHQHLHITEDELPTSVPADIQLLWNQAGIAKSKTGVPIMNLDNCIRILEYTGLLKSKLWYDEFYVDYFTTWRSKEPRPWSERDMLELYNMMQREYGFQKLQIATVEQLVKFIAYQNQRNEAEDFFRSLKWDGVPRIENFCHEYLGAEDNEYTRAVSKNWLISIAARILKPGCQVDNMVILEGRQGARKSSVLRALGGKWFTEASAGFGTKDFYQQIQGKIIVEIAELDMFNKADVNTLKRVVSSPTDEFRAPYERRQARYPRKCVFVGTTNQDAYLMDETGNRRYWPISCGEIKYDDVAKDREQLLAEAVYMFKAGEKWWTVPPVTEEVQASRMLQDPWTETIAKFVDDPLLKYKGVTCSEVALTCLDIEVGRLTARETMRVGRVLRSLGWKPGKPTTIDNKRVKPFYPPGHDKMMPPPVQQPLHTVKNYAPGMD